jgi:hypothetical protein
MDCSPCVPVPWERKPSRAGIIQWVRKSSSPRSPFGRFVASVKPGTTTGQSCFPIIFNKIKTSQGNGSVFCSPGSKGQECKEASHWRGKAGAASCWWIGKTIQEGSHGLEFHLRPSSPAFGIFDNERCPSSRPPDTPLLQLGLRQKMVSSRSVCHAGLAIEVFSSATVAGLGCKAALVSGQLSFRGKALRGKEKTEAPGRRLLAGTQLCNRSPFRSRISVCAREGSIHHAFKHGYQRLTTDGMLQSAKALVPPLRHQ